MAEDSLGALRSSTRRPFVSTGSRDHNKTARKIDSHDVVPHIQLSVFSSVLLQGIGSVSRFHSL
jgi:hypothetical protein